MTAPNTDAVERLVARLERKGSSHWPGDEPCEWLINPDGPEAAATITAQAARIAELELALSDAVNTLDNWGIKGISKIRAALQGTNP